MLSCPILLTKDHQLDDFSCNVDSLNDWLKKRAYQNQLSGASRTYVVLVCRFTYTTYDPHTVSKDGIKMIEDNQIQPLDR